VTDLKKSDLHIAFDKVERSDGHVSETTAEDPTGRAGGVEGSLGAATKTLLLLVGEDPSRRFEERPAALLLGLAPSIIFSSVVAEDEE